MHTHLLRFLIFSSLASGPNGDTSSHACPPPGSGERTAPNTHCKTTLLCTSTNDTPTAHQNQNMHAMLCTLKQKYKRVHLPWEAAGTPCSEIWRALSMHPTRASYSSYTMNQTEDCEIYPCSVQYLSSKPNGGTTSDSVCKISKSSSKSSNCAMRNATEAHCPVLLTYDSNIQSLHDLLAFCHLVHLWVVGLCQQWILWDVTLHNEWKVAKLQSTPTSCAAWATHNTHTTFTQCRF